jgi:hypothetical protein
MNTNRRRLAEIAAKNVGFAPCVLRQGGFGYGRDSYSQ